MILLILLGCAGPPSKGGDTGTTPTEPTEPTEPTTASLRVQVSLDDEPAEGVLISQPGTTRQWSTDGEGQVVVELLLGVEGDLALAASHPEARVGGDVVYDSTLEAGELSIALSRFQTDDNPDYVFQDPGTPERSDTTGQCSHCHLTMTEDWYASAHRSSASNPRLQDLYAGVAGALDEEEACLEAGGRWAEGRQPGTEEAAWRCYLGEGVLPALNEGCGEESPCDGVDRSPEATGACADCHAPGIDGELGGRDLLEATGHAFDYGVHCDTCHKVESVDLEALEPGVAGRLRILRPSELTASKALGPYLPLTFGPYPDVLNPRMGSVERGHFTDGTVCAGCHQYDQPVLLPGEALDAARWPEGLLPVHSTWEELAQGPLGPEIPCNSCHMPPDAVAGNSADLGTHDAGDAVGIATGWYRPPGSVRRHTWFGPRSEEQRMLELAAWIELEVEQDEGELRARATVHNSGPAHAIPTGEPLRSLILLVEARCGEERLRPTGGDVVPDYGGAYDQKHSGEDWSIWPGAEPGQHIRVARRTGEWRDYTGFGPFGDGRFSAEEKGLPVEQWAGEAEILAVDGEGRVQLDQALPEGDLAWRVSPGALPEEGEPAGAWAGAPGMAFARLMVGPQGQRNVPHFLAVDIASDNRILPGQSSSSEHRFEGGCEAPVVHARLLHRAFPLELAAERGWALSESVMAEALR
jgi:hypothetical protein